MIVVHYENAGIVGFSHGLKNYL